MEPAYADAGKSRAMLWLSGLTVILGIAYVTGQLGSREAGGGTAGPRVFLFLNAGASAVAYLVFFPEARRRLDGRAVRGGLLTRPFDGTPGFGVAWGALSGAAFGLSFVLTSRVSGKSSPSSLAFVTLAGIASLALGSLLLDAAVRATLAGVPALAARPIFLGCCAYNTAPAGILGFRITNRFQRLVPATRAAVLHTLQPVVAAIAGTLLGNESLSGSLLAGGGLILAARASPKLRRFRVAAPRGGPDRARAPGLLDVRRPDSAPRNEVGGDRAVRAADAIEAAGGAKEATQKTTPGPPPPP